MSSYFQPLVEQYYFINIIPDIEIFGLQGHFYFYIFILFVLAFIFIFYGVFVMKGFQNQGKISYFKNVFLCSLFIFWFIAILPWFITQIHWLIHDINNYYGQSIHERQRIAVSNVIKNYGLDQNWHDFYDFVIFGKDRVPKDSKIYILPANPVFQNFAHYYLYPDMLVINSSETADYIFSFNVDLQDDLINFETFKQFGPNKFILR